MRSYEVRLTQEERAELQKLISAGVAPARKLTRARILLKADEGFRKAEISRALDVASNTVTNVCRSFQMQRLTAVERKKPEREYFGNVTFQNLLPQSPQRGTKGNKMLKTKVAHV